MITSNDRELDELSKLVKKLDDVIDFDDDDDITEEEDMVEENEEDFSTILKELEETPSYGDDYGLKQTPKQAPIAKKRDLSKDDLLQKLMEQYSSNSDEEDVYDDDNEFNLDEILQKEEEEEEEEGNVYERAKRVIKHVKLGGELHNDLNDDTILKKIGKPNVLKACKSYIFIGTKKGLIVSYNRITQKREFILGTVEMNNQEYPIVTSMDVYENILIAGYSNGNITFWNTMTYLPIKTFENEFNGRPILYLTLLDGNQFLASDGIVIKWSSLRKNIFSLYNDSLMIQMPENTLITDIQILPKGEMNHPTNSYVLVAIATATLVYVYQLESTPKCIFTKNILGGKSPYISWKPVMIPNGEYKSLYHIHTNPIPPYLAIGYGDSVTIYEIKVDVDDCIKFEEIANVILTCTCKGIAWLAEQVLAVIDEYVRIWDPLALTKVDEFGLQNDLLSFHAFKGSYLGENQKSDKIVVQQPSAILYLLSNHVIHAISIHPWDMRIRALAQVSYYQDAFNFAIELYRGGGNAVVGLPASKHEREAAVASIVSELLFKYFDDYVIHHSDQNKEKVFSEIGETCIRYCLQINDFKIFLRLYDRFIIEDQKKTFITLLEPFILQDRLPSLITPGLFESFVDYYQNAGLYDRLEQCLLHVDLSQSDIVNFGKLKQICEGVQNSKKMLKCYLYLYQSFGKYREGLESLFRNLNSPSREYGNVLLEYMKLSIVGRPYSHALVLTPLQEKTMKEETLKFLFTKKDGEIYLKQFIKFDPEQTFQVLSSSFNDKTPTSPFISNNDSWNHQILNRQTIVEELIQTFMDDKPIQSIEWNLEQKTYFYAFLAECLYKDYYKPIDNDERVIVDYVHRIFSHLCQTSIKITNKQRDARQEYLKGILEKYSTFKFRDDFFKEACERAQFYRVALYLYKKENDYMKIIECYLRDSMLRTKVFEYIDTIYHEDRIEDIKESIHTHLIDLMTLNHEKTSEFLIKHCEEEHSYIIRTLYPYPELLFKYLHYIFSSHPEILEKRKMDSELETKYIELLCDYSPHDVYSYLTTHQDIQNLDDILKKCEENNITDAISFILERKGEVSSALKFIKEKVDDKLGNLTARLIQEANILDENDDKYLKPVSNLPFIDGQPVEKLKEALEVEEKLMIAISMCKRNTARKTLQEEDVKKLWYALFDKFAKPHRLLHYAYLGIQPPADDQLSEKAEIDKKIEYYQRMIQEQEEEIEEAEREFKQNLINEDEYNEKKGDAEVMIENLQKVCEEFMKKAKSMKENEDLQMRIAAPTDAKKLANLWLQRIYKRFIELILSEMIGSIPIPVILQKLIKDYSMDDFGFIRNMIMKLQSRFEYDHQLMITANNILESDNFNLGVEYQKKMAKGLTPKKYECPLSHKPLNYKGPEGTVEVALLENGDALRLDVIRRQKKHINDERYLYARRVRRKKKQDEKEMINLEEKSEKSRRIKQIEDKLSGKSKMYLYKNLHIDDQSKKGTKGNTDFEFAEGLQLMPPIIYENPNRGREREKRIKDAKKKGDIWMNNKYSHIKSLIDLLE